MRSLNAIWWATCFVLVTSGCGGSSSNTQRRPRVYDPEETAPQVAAAKPAVANSSTPGASAPTSNSADNAVKSVPPTEQTYSETDRRKRVINQLRQISKALETYREKNGTYPHRTVGIASTLSWRVTLLPFLGHRDLYLKFRQNEPWDSPHNRTLLREIPDVYMSLEHPDEKTNFQFITGLNTASASSAGVGENCPDGFENTMFLVETSDALAKPWTQPVDYQFLRHEVQHELFGLRKDCCFAIFGGTSGARRIAADISDQNLLALTTPAGGERVLANDVTSYPYPEVEHELIAKLEKNPPQRFVDAKPKTGDDEVADARGSSPKTGSATTDANTDSPAATNDPRLPVPDDDAVKKAAALVKEIFGGEYEAAKKPDQKRAFAKKMLEAAGKMVVSDKTGAFVMYRAARDVAASSGDVETSLAAIDKLAETFRVEPLAMKTKALEQAATGIQSDAELQTLYDAALKLADGALAKDDFANAKQLFGLALNAARRSNSKERITRVTAKQDDMQQQRLAYNRLADHVHSLVRDPHDPAANAAVGKYYCLIKRDWDRGLEMLAKGNDEKFSELAHRERSTPATSEAQVEIGDLWWECGENHRADLERTSVRMRAVFWYEQALPSLAASLTKSRAEKRIAEVKSEDQPTPRSAPGRDTARARR